MKCEACEQGNHINCGMQTWCECECDGPDSIEFDPPPSEQGPFYCVGCRTNAVDRPRKEKVMIERRRFLTGLVAALAAPAIVPAASLMPVKTVLWTPPPVKIVTPPEGWQEVKAWRMALRFEYDADKKILTMLELDKEPLPTEGEWLTLTS